MNKVAPAGWNPTRAYTTSNLEAKGDAMTDSNGKSTSSKSKLDKPKKPYPDFPLTPHNSGAWMKKIRGSIHYFGRWSRQVKGKRVRVDGDGWEEALKLYQAQREDLYAGRTPRVTNTEDLILSELCNRFLTAKSRKLKSGELGQRMFGEYKATCDLLINEFGKKRLVEDLAADDFEALRVVMAERWGPVRLGNEITRVKSLFKYAHDNGLIDKPARFGSEFKKPDKKVMRKHRAANGKKMLEADELRQLLDAAPVPLKAMILLGLNAGLGNHDVACLPESALDLENGWLDYPRAKTGIERRCPLWPETVTAIQEAIAERPELRQESAEGLVFLTARGRQWLTEGIANPVATQSGRLMKEVGVHKPGIGFYTLRHIFRTVADETLDRPAIDRIMGHADGSMADAYRERIADSRLQAVVDHVHDWLFGTDDGGGNEQPEPQQARFNAPSLAGTSPEVTVEFDQDGIRARKHFDNAHSAKRFYIAMDVEGRNPSAIVEDDRPKFRVIG